MEGLSLLLTQAASSPQFSYHPKCNLVKLTHLCFADDLLVFSTANATSVSAIVGALAEFESLSRLKANPAKSSIFPAGVLLELKQDILNFSQMPAGSLSVRYLRVPLITKRIYYSDCEILVAQITARIDFLTVRNLSFASEIQLLSSVLFNL
jgi:hypothetical protein